MIDDSMCKMNLIGNEGKIYSSPIFHEELLVFLDHDLDGVDELKKVNFSKLKDTIFIVHSINPVGADNIIRPLNSV